MHRGWANQLGSYCNYLLFRNRSIQANAKVEIGGMNWKSNCIRQGLLNEREARRGSKMFLKFPH